MKRIAKLLLLCLSGICAVGGLITLPAQSIVAENNETTVTIDVNIPLSLDTTDRGNPVFRGTGNLYMITEYAESHQCLQVSILDSFEMNAPDGVFSAPNGIEVAYMRWQEALSLR